MLCMHVPSCENSIMVKARNVWEFLFHHHHCHCLKEINPEYSLDGLMLKLQYFGHLMRRTDSLEKILMLGMIEGGRRKGWQRITWLDGIMDSMDVCLSKLRSWWWTGKPGVLQSIGSQRVRHSWVIESNRKIHCVEHCLQDLYWSG